MKSITLPLLVNTRSLQNLVGQSKIELDTASYEAATGRASDLSDHMKGDTGAIHRLEKLMADADRRVASTTLLQQEAANVQATLTSIGDVALDIGSQLEGAIGLDDDETIGVLTIEADAQLDAIWGRLNTSFNGSYQFSGAATDTQPLGDLQTFKNDIRGIVATTGAAGADAVEAALDTYFDDPAGVFQTTIYQGSTSDAPDRQVSETRRLGVDAKAIDEGVRDTLRGLALLISADATDNQHAEDLRSAAAERLNTAGMKVIEKQSIVGATEEDAARLLIENGTEKTTYELMLTDKIAVDQYDAATRMSQLETQLQAVYLMTARISSLSLTNYL